MAFTLDPEVAEALAPSRPRRPAPLPRRSGTSPPAAPRWRGSSTTGDTAQPFPDDVTITDHELTTADGATIRLRWYARRNAPSEPGPAALYMHGGGMISGHIDLFNGLASRYVSASGTPILAVDYRRAPEHPHPAPVEDTYAALVWLHEHAADLGIDPARIAVVGDSAGGGLAAAVSILARDRKGPAIAKQILVMPMLDDRTPTPTPSSRRSSCGRGTTTAPAGRPCSATPSAAQTPPPPPPQRASPTRADSRPPTSRSANSTSSGTRTSPMPCASARLPCV